MHRGSLLVALLAVAFAGRAAAFQTTPVAQWRRVARSCSSSSGGGGRSNTLTAAAAAAAEAAGEKSALVLGWFGAQDKELEFVKKIYKKKGFSDVVVHASPIAACSKPRGWYRSVASLSQAVDSSSSEASADQDTAARAAEIARSFDVVHVMSGGFLNLYLTLLSGVPLRYSTLVLDSTPILPKPASFTRFARAYMASMKGTPFAMIPKIVPAWLHLAYVSARWTVSSAYVGLKHAAARLLVAIGLSKPGSVADGTTKLSSFAPYAVTMRYQRIVDDCIETIFGNRKAGDPLHAIFVHNPEDPYINNDDLQRTIVRARDEYGCTVDEVSEDDGGGGGGGGSKNAIGYCDRYVDSC